MLPLKCIISFLAFILSMFLWTDPALSVPQLNSYVSQKEISPEDTAVIMVELTWPQAEGNYKFAMPDIGTDQYSSVRVGESQEIFLKDNQPWIKKTFKISIKPKPRSGLVSVNSFGIPYVEEGSAVSEILEVPALSFSVVQPSPWIRPMTFIGTGFGILLLAAAFSLTRLRRKKAAASAADSPESFDEDIRITNVQEIIQSSNSENAKEHLRRLEKEFKSFISRRYAFPDGPLREEEMLECLRSRGAALQDIQRIENIFQEFRRAKYAGVSSSEREIREIGREITAFINGKRVIGEVKL